MTSRIAFYVGKMDVWLEDGAKHRQQVNARMTARLIR